MKAPPMSWIDEIVLTAWTRKRVAIRQQNQCALIGCLNQCELKKSFQNWVKKNWRGSSLQPFAVTNLFASCLFE